MKSLVTITQCYEALKKMKRFISIAVVMLIGVVVLKGANSTVPSMPIVDLRVGPVAVNQQATNIALSLSVEFPTVGAAYRTSLYDHSATYPGYWHEKSCYIYRDTTTGAPLSGEYFVRTGSVDADGYCNTTGSNAGYSGNALNFVASSSIDILRYALTGGNRVVDTATSSVLERAYLYNGWALNNTTYFPARRIPSALEGKVTPDFAGTGDVYGGSCQDKVWFGRANTANANCDNPGTAGNLNPTVTDPSSSTTVVVNAGAPAPTGGIFLTTTYEITNPLVTSSVSPTVGPITYNDITTFGSGTTTAVPPVNAAANRLADEYIPNGLTSTVAPPAPEPTVIVGTTALPLATRYLYKNSPGGTVRSLTLAASLNVCRSTNSPNPANFVGNLTVGGVPTAVSNANCSSNAFPFVGLTSRGGLAGPFPLTVYEPLQVVNVYARHSLRPVYRSWTTTRVFDTYDPKDNYRVPGTKIGPMFARVKVCDSAEALLRTDLCKQYPSGNYKPVGEIQNKASGARIAAFGYALENENSRYGGVLRAPMQYLGPQYRDSNGTLQNNLQSEWDAATGVFTADPRGASPSFAISGTINYLNKFGSTGSTKGAYKGYDPVGELYYETLRYYMGLGPTPAATAGLTAAMYDGFPIYSTAAEAPSTLSGWTDALQNSCQRNNYILNIGDVNTWHDRQLPGHGTGISSALVNTTDPARAAENLLGSGTFNAVDWLDKLTGFEKNLNRSYTDALGRTQSTSGNPNPRTTLPEMGSNGTAINSAWYWAAAAYWANTQPIRNDTKDGKSMKDVRVRTFTIDVDEGGNGSIEDSNPRGNKPRSSAAYLAGKYGYFRDANRDGNPFVTTGGVTSNAEWEDVAAPNTPNGYVLAGQAQRLIDAIRKFFKDATGESGAVSVSSVSSQRFTANDPNGDLYEPRFNANNWSGTIVRRTLVRNTSTTAVEAKADVVWDAGKILTKASLMTTSADPSVIPADRKIFSYRRDGSVDAGMVFKSANFSQLDTAVRDALNTNPANNTVDNKGAERVDWIRGNRSDEIKSGAGFLRARESILGDFINSGPVFKKRADPAVQGDGYPEFSLSVNTRTAVIYAGANDGMFHAFRATDGKELFAYVPRAVSENLNQLTNPSYLHLPYVDGVTAVGEAQIGSSWRTLAVSGMGGGAQGVFALDVTNPDSFNETNVMFEFTDRDDPDMGNVLRAPSIVRMRMAGSGAAQFKWFIAVSSGYNNYQNDGYSSSTGQQALFLLSIDKKAGQPWAEGSNYYKMKLDATSTSFANALANPGYSVGSNGEATIFYAGDLRGNMWKFDLSSGLNSTNIANAVKKSSGSTIPLAIAKDPDGVVQPITVTPLISPGLREGNMVVFGTGKFTEPSDAPTTQTQSVYGIWDPASNTVASHNVVRGKLFERTVINGTTGVTLSGSATFAFGDGSSGTYRGWFFNLPNLGERIAVEMSELLGTVNINSTIPEGDCSGDGTGYAMCTDFLYGSATCDFIKSNVGFLSKPNPFLVDGDYSTRSSTGKRTFTTTQGTISPGNKVEGGTTGVLTSQQTVTKIPAGRLAWREIKNFK